MASLLHAQSSHRLPAADLRRSFPLIHRRPPTSVRFPLVVSLSLSLSLSLYLSGISVVVQFRAIDCVVVVGGNRGVRRWIRSAGTPTICICSQATPFPRALFSRGRGWKMRLTRTLRGSVSSPALLILPWLRFA